MNFWVSLILNLCIIIPAITGLVRFRKINRAFYPFIYCMWIGAVAEISSEGLIMMGHSNAYVADIYVLIEAFLYTWLFSNWKLFNEKKIYGKIIVVILLLGWSIEMLFNSTPIYFNSYFRIGYSFLIVIASITIINRQVARERKSLLKNAIFLIGIGFVFYFTLQALVEIFWLYGLHEKAFSVNVFNISVITNFITNLLYTVAILWIPTKQNFSMPSY